MAAFDEVLSDTKQEHGPLSDKEKAIVERAWNAALDRVEDGLELDENLGDVKDSIRFLRP